MHSFEVFPKSSHQIQISSIQTHEIIILVIFLLATFYSMHHISTFSSNFICLGKPTKSLTDLLRENNLPVGLFPQNITCYELDESKSKLVVHLSSPCEVCFKDSSIIRYSARVKATLSRGKLTGIDGMKTKVLVWVKVTSITVESYKSDKVWFMAGVKKSRSRDAYEAPRDGIRVEDI